MSGVSVNIGSSFSKCNLHVPHKANMQDWASMLGHELFPNDPVKAASLANIARRDHENWNALERFLNEQAPGCFGGSGCGVPGPVAYTTKPIADGEDSCAEGDGTESHGDRSVTMGLRNIIDALDPNSVIVGGHDNNIQNGNNDGNNVILAGSTNVIDGTDHSAVGGDTCTVKASDSFAYGTDILIDAASIANIALGEFLTVTNEGVEASVVLGSNAVGFVSGQLAHSSGSGSTFAVNGFTRAAGQASQVIFQRQTLDATPGTMGGIIFQDLPYAVAVEGQLVAKDNAADVNACWSFTALYATDGAGNGRLVGSSMTLLFADAGAAAWAATIVANTASFTGDWLDIQVTGAAATTINWTATLRMTEVLGGF